MSSPSQGTWVKYGGFKVIPGFFSGSLLPIELSLWSDSKGPDRKQEAVILVSEAGVQGLTQDISSLEVSSREHREACMI